jgi:hypothetical protein
VLFPDRRRFQEFVGLFETKQSAGETIDIERKAMRSDGTLILIRMRGARRRSEPAARDGTIWVIEDITGAPPRRARARPRPSARRGREPRQEPLPSRP